MALPHVTPLCNGHLADVLPVEGDITAVVLTVTVDVTAHRRLAGAALGADQVALAALESDILQPHLAGDAVLACKHTG